MSLGEGPGVAQNGPSMVHLFGVFSKFRRDNDYEGLVDYLITNYPQNVKNRTFNFHNTGHIFHMLYAYVPSPSNKQRKQIRLDCMENLLRTTKNDFCLYEDLMGLIDDEYKCPCELISARLNDNIVYNESLKNKNFDIKPCKLKKEPIDAILFKYSINWKNSLNKKRVLAGKRKSGERRVVAEEETAIVVAVDKIVTPSSLKSINGYTIEACVHDYVVEERQLRAGDEAVSFVRYCVKCGCGQ
uniref:LEF-5 n=1 Tax=Cydia pomonella granulosis virus TaxID=28289 RepID=A0A097P2F0_GVCP|nr:ORF87 lef-5 [Cydia pomonella granulovirus]AIU37013.1 ORF87 lef-5 [Cydia pomonella granulovirus]AIU37155.1 ORF87 lef-5 [Cydia pomonella granulovirus]AIU37294.1 ORF87 lef-5 [Cydia pomonella granulovirus]QGY99317.1 LEF-5 [Cydia pomonella granulovirus]